jgi:hypothetical protein
MNTTESGVYSLVKRFVQRQSLAFDVLKAFRPYLVGSADRRPSKEYMKATFKGYWGTDNEWQY